MPWKIRRIDIDGKEPVVKLWDKANAIYLDVEMVEPREAHIYIGDPNPDRSRLHIVADEEGVFIARSEGYRRKDIAIMDNILETMGYPRALRRVLKLLKPAGVRRNPPPSAPTVHYLDAKAS